ncbi:MAG: hypothetical protein A3I88_00895 [Candidatus Portnoybacteria bacterium RIFCSPLOWO2_12_FULL_39_9]|uniref:Uncharacterized protein n=1 Tax=Candidatus Portnoybacteria bacterium RIFCSPHIGHO2_12_FULL_38_9 TaxID=1801997 RepID=A0A1G2FET9_9BACT|nr:MAG: hypothetical protein A3H00_02215 [Candidatus Portnoybacteria bacterium RBG_13_40_8]OGZ35664.1 MAG: hypothetical protein A2646_01315 [Candidatus Portnoybacteria bacterium RIFCSPHIGHO2_02_FULL_39_12]OGZ36317.1 MAG: hypothetical protein A3J64_03145 [Candidatus Portnoybacteria bacterium RIFCSPHIGHO2_12_FULL_38_9]OGZ40781.1 MAG: hypothetical protein A3I88_00895 [Candidatus Portnoybacteria bacterium RIFCSPLOWO2_12_FULL_39_9]
MEWYWWIVSIYCLIGFVIAIAVVIEVEIKAYLFLSNYDRDSKMLKMLILLILRCLKFMFLGIFCWGYFFIVALIGRITSSLDARR